MTRTLRSMAVLLFLAVSINAASISAAPPNKKMFLEEIIDILEMKSQCSTEKVALVSFTNCKPDVFCKAGIALKHLKCGKGDPVSKLSRALMGYNTKLMASCKVNKEVEIELQDFLEDLKRCAREQYRHI